MKETSTVQLNFVDKFRKQMFNNEFMLSYKGEISQEIILALLDMTEKKLDSNKAERAIKSRIFNVMIGCLQNIAVHTERGKHYKSSMFTIGRHEEGYTIYSGNAVRKARVRELRQKLEKINQMTEQELNEFYLFMLKTREIKDKRGVGLGLIHIARKTGNDLFYDFEDIDDEYTFFSLRTLIKSNQ